MLLKGKTTDVVFRPHTQPQREKEIMVATTYIQISNEKRPRERKKKKGKYSFSSVVLFLFDICLALFVSLFSLFSRRVKKQPHSEIYREDENKHVCSLYLFAI